ncbi:MAG: LysR family transcriptional regulator [Actinomycetota bacterium]|nr:LysR family transcriptional regulator [Actinomycetota bacterium]
MELHQLRYLTAVVDEGSFTAAGRREKVSQSGVSAQIRLLERELGGELLDRSGRGVTVTDLGAAVLPHARAALQAIAELSGAVDEVSGLLRGSVAFGMVTGCDLPGFMDALADVHLAHPHLLVTLVEGPSDVLRRSVLSGDLDLALVAWSGEIEAGLGSAIVVDEETELAVPAGHPFAELDDIDLESLVDETVICLSPGTGVRSAFDGLIAERRSSVRVGLEASSPDTVAGLAARGLGVAVLSSSMVAAHPGLHPVRVRGAQPRSRLGLVWRSLAPSSAAGRALLAAMTRELVSD